MCLAACILAAYAVVLDVCCSLPVSTHDNIPASLRATGVVVVALLASAPILDAYILEQRIILALVLAVSSLWGAQTASEIATTSDGIFTLVALAATIAAFSTSGKAGDSLPGFKRSGSGFDPNLVALCASTLFYWGLRQVKTAFFGYEHALFTSSFAIVDELSIVSKAFCAAIGIGVGFLLLLNHELLESKCLVPFHDGLHTLGFALLVGACVQQVAAEAAATTSLGILFDADACSAQHGLCADADRARRFYFCFSQSTSAFVVALTVFLLANQEKQPPSRSQYHNRQLAWNSLHKMLLLLLAAFVVVFVYPLDLSISMGVLLLTIAVATDFPLFALLLHTVGVGITVFDLDHSYFSHWALAATLALLALLSIGTTVSDALYANLLFIPWIELACAIITRVLLGMQLALFLASVCLPVAANGRQFETPELFTERHFLTAVFLLEFSKTRHETVTNWVLGVAYFVPILTMFVVWLGTSNSGDSVYANTLDVSRLVVCGVCVLVSWVSVGLRV